MTSELPSSFPWTSDIPNRMSVSDWSDFGSRKSFGTDTDYHHAYSAFCVQWLAVGVCALVGRP